MMQRAPFKGKAVWCGPGDAGTTSKSVAAFVERIRQTGFNTIVMEVKGGHGLVRWPSKLIPEVVESGYEDFDLPAVLLKECRKRGMMVHAWFIDYMEGPESPAFRKHPEWAARNPHGDTLVGEPIRGRKAGILWMCPAHRPGYTDQWLIPLYREFAERYAFDAVHHDYIRYPGDFAPDSYCFCDHCLKEMPRFNGLYSTTYPGEPFYHESYDRGYLESHWEQSPRALPGNWDRLPRQMKSEFLLKGSFFQGGLYDLDYFFYTYRTHWVTQFARECAEAVRRARPEMEISAAVFKNPIHSGRFIGQDWRQFAPYVEYCMPMDYRDHFPGSFEVYLNLLEETIESQKAWAGGYKHLWPGFACNFLFFEEERPLRRLLECVRAEDYAGAEEAYMQVHKSLYRVARKLSSEFDSWLIGGTDEAAFVRRLEKFVAHPPEAYWPQEKVTAVIERIRATGVEGVTVFCAGQLQHYGLWDTVRDALAD